MRFLNRAKLVRWSVIFLVPALAALGLLPCFGQQIHRNLFETNQISWIKGSADIPFVEIVHAMTEMIAHEGQRSEYLQVNVPQQGTHIYYYYPTANAPISDELTVSVWVKSNKPNLQLMAHLVLPKEANPSSP